MSNMCTNIPTSLSTDDKQEKARNSNSNDEIKSKPKRPLKDPFLRTRNAYWETKKEEGMTYEEFNDLWESMPDYEKNFLKTCIRTFGHK